ncbi:MAG: aldehyde dehydrogenase family protein [Myxococcales bacterium]|nr:aldehyde dehydrogenase family protein [Myxococcales bacterium]
MSGDVFPLQSPLDGSALAPVVATLPREIAELVRVARSAQIKWQALEISERVDALAPLARRILARAEEIAELLHREVGKPIEEAALAEVLPNADLVDYWCDTIEEALETKSVELDPLTYPGKSGRILRDARGVIALITPWNFPVAIPLRTLVPALLAGNAVVFKPSEVTPRAGALVASLFDGLVPAGLVTLVQGGADVGRAVVEAELDLVVFTGSVPTGKVIARACAERLIPCSLELGGKDAAIVLEDADLERAANGIVWGTFSNAGQSCAAIERVFVHEKVAKEFTEKIVNLTRALSSADCAVMTTKTQKDKVRAQLDGAIAAGATVLAGGAPGDTGHAFAPTIVQMEGESGASELMTEETFGPIMALSIVASEDEAVERTNASRYALTTSVWTKKIARGNRLARRLKSGIVTINNHGFTAAIPAAPWTGQGETGYGVTNSAHCLSSLTRVRFVLEDKNRQKRELWWYPYTPVLRTIAFAMARLKGGDRGFRRITAFFQLVPAILKRLFARG